MNFIVVKPSGPEALVATHSVCHPATGLEDSVRHLR